jgi:hypothetical protein
MKRISKLVAGFAIMVSMVLFSPAGTHAATATPVFGHKYTRGISRVSIYIDGSTYPRASYWEPRITEAVESWRYTDYGGNQFDRVYVSSNVASQMDFHAAYDSHWTSTGNDNVLGETEFYNAQGTYVYPYNYDWYYAKIIINDDLFRQSSFSNAEAVRTFIHEMGHAFGLAHNFDNTYSIMYPYNEGCQVFKVQQVDNDALNRIYY